MRTLIALACLLAGCDSYDPPVYGTCSTDSDCGSDVCARSGECLASDAISPPVTFRWTINGQPATASTCAPHPQLHLVLWPDNAADPNLTLEISCTSGAGLVLDRIPAHLLGSVELGPATVADPGEFPNDVGWDSRATSPGDQLIGFDLTF